MKFLLRLNCWVIGLLLTSALNYSVADEKQLIQNRLYPNFLMQVSMAESSQVLGKYLAICAGLLASVELEHFPDLTSDDIERLNKESQLRLEEALKYLSWTEVDRLARLAKARTKSLSYYELQLLRNGINECEFFSGRLKSPQQ